LADSPEFRRRVEAAERAGIPSSKLDGREPREVTEYEYDDEGRLTRSVTVREPEWTEQDVAERLALAEYRDSLCSCCGLPKNQVLIHERDAPRFVVNKQYCLARKALAEVQRAYMKSNKPTAAEALVWSVRADRG
jgi:YD repeat-containing protein